MHEIISWVAPKRKTLMLKLSIYPRAGILTLLMQLLFFFSEFSLVSYEERICMNLIYRTCDLYAIKKISFIITFSFREILCSQYFHNTFTIYIYIYI